MVDWHDQLNGYEFEQAPGDGEGQGSLASCSPRGCKELVATEQQQQEASVCARSVVSGSLPPRGL